MEDEPIGAVELYGVSKNESNLFFRANNTQTHRHRLT